MVWHDFSVERIGHCSVLLQKLCSERALKSFLSAELSSWGFKIIQCLPEQTRLCLGSGQTSGGAVKGLDQIGGALFFFVFFVDDIP